MRLTAVVVDCILASASIARAAEVGKLHRRSAKECQGKRDCNYNGDCVYGSCQCVAYFTGSACNILNLVPTAAGSGLRTVDSEDLQVSSWGGSVLRHDDGQYHMWAAEMVNGAGIKTWISNSQIVHAVADKPEGPYTRKEKVWPVFAHEPTVSRAPTGEYVMYFTGGGPSFGQKQIPCTGHSCHGYNGTSDLSCPNDQQCNVSEPLSSWMSWAAQPDGPWSKPALVPAPGGGDTNLAAVIFRNGSMFGLGRPGHYWASPDWRDLSKYIIGATAGDLRGEDPMVWIDEREGESVLHAVLHGGGWSDPFGFHYFSDDGGRTWVGDNKVKTYENKVQIGASDLVILSRRERPHIILGGESGRTPVALSNGVTDAWPCNLDGPKPDGSRCPPPCPDKPLPGSNGTSIWCPVDFCYTMVQSLATSSSALVV